MHVRTLVAAALVATTATLAACSAGDNTLGLGGGGGGGTTDTLSNARIRFVNATATSYDVATGGSVATGNGGIAYGTSSTCISTNATTPNLAVRVAGTSNVVPGFATGYQSGVSYTVIAFTSASGTTQFATIADTYTPAAGEIGFRVFNAAAASSSYDVYVTAPGASLATTPPTFSAVTAGTNSTFTGVSTTSSQQVRITATGSKTVLADLGNVAFATGQNVTLVIAAPVTGTAPRTFLAAGC